MTRLLLTGLILSSFLIKPEVASAASWRLLEVERISVEGFRTGYYRDPYMPQYSTHNGDEQWFGGANFIMDFTLVDLNRNYRLYWNNYLHTDGTRSQIRRGGWQWDCGIELGPKIDLFYKHHSQHSFEAEQDSRFPLRDTYGLRFNLYRRGR